MLAGIAAFVLLLPVVHAASTSAPVLSTLLALLAATISALLSGTGHFLVQGRALAVSRFPLTLFSIAVAALLTGGAVFLVLLSGLAGLEGGVLHLSEAAYGAALSGNLFLFMTFLAAERVRSRELSAARDEALRAELRAREAELRALQFRVSPHFLFNALNSVAALTRRDPPLAYDVCLQLAALLEERLGESHTEWVPLSEELDTARRYLAIEKVRFADRLVVAEHITTEVANLAVPRLILQPLLENAVKHGVSLRSEPSTVRYSAEVVETPSGRRLRLRVDNPVAPSGRARSGGHGLTLVRERVLSLTEGRGSLRAERDGEAYHAELLLPIRRAPTLDSQRTP